MASAPIQRQWEGSALPARKPSPDSPPKSVTSSKFNIGPPGSLGSGKRLVVTVPPWAKYEQPAPDEDIFLSSITAYTNGNSNDDLRGTYAPTHSISEPWSSIKQSRRSILWWIFVYARGIVGYRRGKEKRPEGLREDERPWWNPQKWLAKPEETHHPDRRASSDVVNEDLIRPPLGTYPSRTSTAAGLGETEEPDGAKDMDRWTEFITVVPGQHGRFKVEADSMAIHGGFSDVWQCDAKFYDGKVISVAVKKFRTVRIPHDADANATTNKLLKRLSKELDIWMTLQHPNIMPLIGFVLTDDMCMISPWYPNGNIGDYIIQHPEVDRIKLVLDVACGLAYLHNLASPVVHGDMKPDNVLINDNGDAHIMDFGLSSILETEAPLATSFTTASLQDSGNIRWMAPELVMEEGCTRSPSTDVYSFGSVALYIYTGEVPFKRIPTMKIIYALIQEQTPLGERDDYPALWAPGVEWFQDFLVVCWDLEPESRPSMTNLEERIQSRGVKGGEEPSRS